MQIILALLALSTASPGDATHHVIKNPDWLKRPSESSFLSVYPQGALARGVGGRAMIHCTVTVVGSLRDCAVKDENPEGYGFGAAAIALSPQFEMSPMTVDGTSVESAIDIPIDFVRPNLPEALGSRLPARRDLGQLNLTQVAWTRAPTLAQVSAAYPEKARAAHVGGLVTLDCTFEQGGRVRDCEVAEETPQGYDFGRAARSLASDFVGPGTLPDGRSTAGDTTQFVVAFSPEMIDVKSPVIGKPTWTHLPEALDMAAAFPAAARAAHVDVGHVVLGCFVAVGGKLISCAVQKETPPGLGFGAAAMSLSSQFQVSVWTDEGLPTVGGSITVPIRYESGTPVNSASAKP
jgi:TonB family protein